MVLSYFKARTNKYIILLSLFTLSYFYIILFSGYFSDDAYSYQIKGYLKFTDRSLFGQTFKTIFGWCVGSGRLLIFSQYQHFLFYFIENLYLYKLLILILLLGNFYVLYLLLLKLLKTEKEAFIISCFSMLSLQLREFHDAILGFHGLMPLLGLFFLLQIYFLIIFFENKKKIFLYYSLFFFLISQLMYELSFLFYFFNIIILRIFLKNFKQTILFLKYHFFIFCLIFVIFAILQIRVYYFSQLKTPDYKIISSSFELKIFFKAFIYQVVSGLPGAYFLSQFKNINFDLQFIKYFLFYLFFFFLIQIHIFRTLDNKKTNSKVLINENKLNILICGTIFFIAPSLLLVITPHSKEVLNAGFGFGYIFNFFSSFGLSFFGILILRHFTRTGLKIVYTLILILAPLNSITNIQTVLNSNKIYKYPEIIISKAVKKGILNNLYDDDILIRQKRFASDSVWNYFGKSNKSLIILNPDEVLENQSFKNKSKILTNNNNEYEEYDLKNKRVFILHYFFNDKGLNEGNFFFAKVDSLTKFKKNIISIDVKDLKFYEENRNRLIEIKLDQSINFLKLVYDNDQNPKKYFEEINLKKYNIYK
jgi:hypothetical protein